MRRFRLGVEPPGPPTAEEFARLKAGMRVFASCRGIIEGVADWTARGRPLYVGQVQLDLDRMIELCADRSTIAAYLGVIDYRAARVQRVRAQVFRGIEDAETGETTWTHLAVLHVKFRRPIVKLPVEVVLHGRPIVLETWFDADNRLVAYAFARGY